MPLFDELPPERLYKYRSLSEGDIRTRTLDIIQNNRLWFAAGTDLNDPFDCRPVIRVESDPAVREHYFRRIINSNHRGTAADKQRMLDGLLRAPEEAILEYARNASLGTAGWIGVCSLSADCSHLLMWSHYASNHTGICLEYKTDEGPLELAHRVRYEPDRPVLSPISATSEEIMTAHVTKAMSWEYEKEWRLVEPDGVGLHETPEGALTAVILGARISDPDRAAVQRLLDERANPVELWQAKLGHEGYEVSFEPLNAVGTAVLPRQSALSV